MLAIENCIGIKSGQPFCLSFGNFKGPSQRKGALYNQNIFTASSNQYTKLFPLSLLSQAVRDARSVCGFSSKIEVECRNDEEAIEAARAGADIIMLDNYSPQVALLIS